jgi:hypothetical protein
MENDEDEDSNSDKAVGLSGGCHTDGKQMLEVVERGTGMRKMGNARGWPYW